MLLKNGEKLKKGVEEGDEVVEGGLGKGLWWGLGNQVEISSALMSTHRLKKQRDLWKREGDDLM
ncbi:hypothetical protein, partial [Bacillus sp. WP8]|uniref:hypothetical protein n=1 Tax=Bacillus sp. WP8 TaxID=756828 RepID=UPI001C92E733